MKGHHMEEWAGFRKLARRKMVKHPRTSKSEELLSLLYLKEQGKGTVLLKFDKS